MSDPVLKTNQNSVNKTDRKYISHEWSRAKNNNQNSTNQTDWKYISYEWTRPKNQPTSTNKTDWKNYTPPPPPPPTLIFPTWKQGNGCSPSCARNWNLKPRPQLGKQGLAVCRWEGGDGTEFLSLETSVYFSHPTNTHTTHWRHAHFTGDLYELAGSLRARVVNER